MHVKRAFYCRCDSFTHKHTQQSGSQVLFGINFYVFHIFFFHIFPHGWALSARQWETHWSVLCSFSYTLRMGSREGEGRVFRNYWTLIPILTIYAKTTHHHDSFLPWKINSYTSDLTTNIELKLLFATIWSQCLKQMSFLRQIFFCDKLNELFGLVEKFYWNIFLIKAFWCKFLINLLYLLYFQEKKAKKKNLPWRGIESGHLDFL